MGNPNGLPIFYLFLAILVYYYYICFMNNYILYSVRLIKGILMYDYIDSVIAINIIEAEYIFNDKIISGEEYVITIKK